MRKVHRYGFERGRGWIHPRSKGRRTGERSTTRAACGVPLYPGTPDCGRGIPDAAFVNLPAFAQCRSCWTIVPKAHHGVGLGCASDEAVVGLETALLTLSRLATDLLELGPTWRHRCWFDADRRVCACGRRSEVFRYYAQLRKAGDDRLGRWLTVLPAGDRAVRVLGVFTSSAEAGEIAEVALQ